MAFDSTNSQNRAPVCFVLDVDGVLTTGSFIYSKDGKVYKLFGPDDHDALILLRPFIEIRFVTGDSKGFEISARRIVEDMNFPLDLVSTVKRIDWIKSRYNPLSVVYMGDGIFDHLVMREVGYSIAPANADQNAKRFASHVVTRRGGDRAVAEACLHILERFFIPFDPEANVDNRLQFSGKWTA
jgi:3-deoxy-D-manno-octulosonate 8-phosphate phosphatase (KDO 8-P phosphatase)